MDNRSQVLQRIKSKTTSISDFNFDALIAPPLLSLLSPQDIDYFRKLATSVKYSSKIEFKYSEIDRVMRMRGFRKLSAGTNRVVYRFLENDSIVIKIAIDAVGIRDNPREYENQFYLKPYVTKVFEVSPCGTVGLFERVENIKSREEFESIAGDVFDLISNWIIGKYILEDIGTNYFMNFGVRIGHGPVLLDFPYMYELDGNKLYCQIDKDGHECGGLIDYDDGFNKIVCTKCGAEYRAVELKSAIAEHKIMEKGKVQSTMIVTAKLGDKVIKRSDSSKEARKFESKREKIYKSLPPLGSGLVVMTSYDKANPVEIPEEVKEAVKDIEDNSKFDTKSNFIPEIKEEETPDEGNNNNEIIDNSSEEDTNVNSETADDINSDSEDIESVEESVIETEDDINSDSEDNEPVEESVIETEDDPTEVDEYDDSSTEDDYSDESTSEDDAIVSTLTIGSIVEEESFEAPVGSAPIGNHKRSKKYDPEFYGMK